MKIIIVVALGFVTSAVGLIGWLWYAVMDGP